MPSNKGIVVAARCIAHGLYVPESNRFRTLLTAHLADAAALCLRTGLDPDVLQAATNLQTQRNPSPISAAVKNPQRQQSTASEVQSQHYKPTVAANPQRRNKARATRPPTRRLLPKPTNTIPAIDLTSPPACEKRKAEDPEDIEGLENVGGISGTKKPMVNFFGAYIGSKK
jgi:hypothetical protein